MKPGRRAAVALSAILSVTCNYTPTLPSPLVPSGTQVLAGTVYPNGLTKFVLTTGAPGTLTVTLTREDPGPIPLTIKLGAPGPSGECETISEITTRAGAAPQITTSVEAGQHCLDVSDVGFVKLSGTEFSLSVHLF